MLWSDDDDDDNNNNNIIIIIIILSGITLFNLWLVKICRSNLPTSIIIIIIIIIVDRDSSVGIATRCGLDGPGIGSRWRRDIPRPFRRAMGPIQYPMQWLPSPSRG